MDIPIKTDTATADSIEAAAKKAAHCDKLRFIPVNGKAVVLDRPIDLTGTTTDPYGNIIAKSLYLEGDGATLYAGFALSGTQAMVTWGAPAGLRTGGLSCRGITFVGSLAVQNLSYCKDLWIPAAAALIIQANGAPCSYNDFHIGTLDGGCGMGSALIYNQVQQGDWCNCNDIYGCSMHGEPIKGQPSPVIWQANQAVQLDPGAGDLIRCRFEGDGQIMYSVGAKFSQTLDKCYAEGNWTQGTGGSIQSFTWHDMPAKWASWLSEPRNIATGVLQ